MTNSRSAAPMMRAIRAAFDAGKYRGSESADVFLDALHDAGYEIVPVAHEKAVPISYAEKSYTYQRPVAPIMGVEV